MNDRNDGKNKHSAMNYCMKSEFRLRHLPTVKLTKSSYNLEIQQSWGDVSSARLYKKKKHIIRVVALT